MSKASTEQNHRQVAYVSLGCPKALVDSEHIVADLAERGYEIVAQEDDAHVLVVNTCGFIDAARDESFEVIEQALERAQDVVVTGCLGAQADALKQKFPQLKHISPPAQSAPVIDAVQKYIPGKPLIGGDPQEGVAFEESQRERLTPDHYAYLKISEGCNHRCRFCIIPSMRGDLVSRDVGDVLREAQSLADDGVKEIMLIAQDLSAYGVDRKYAQGQFQGRSLETRLVDLCREIGAIGPWIRLHYVYPYPHVDAVVELMAEGLVLPYLDMPLQHGSAKILKAMHRPAAAEKTLERIARWRKICPDLAIRSSFIVGFPGETEEDVGELLDFLEAAQLDRVGCFTYSPVEGATANALPDHIDERDKLDRQERVYETQSLISAARLKRHLDQTVRVLVDDVQSDGSATARTMYDAPGIDGVVHLADSAGAISGSFAWAKITDCDDHDLYGQLVGTGVEVS